MGDDAPGRRTVTPKELLSVHEMEVDLSCQQAAHSLGHRIDIHIFLVQIHQHHSYKAAGTKRKHSVYVLGRTGSAGDFSAEKLLQDMCGPT